MFRKLYNSIRLFALRRKEPYCTFYNMLGFLPNNIALFQQACRHRSVSRRNQERGDNERLEFLGDAVLSTIVSDILYNTYKYKGEGFLSKTRSKIVQRETLNQVAKEIGLDRIIETSIHSQSHNNYTFGNALEAIIGAIYIDQGFERCRYIVEEVIIKKYIDIEKLARQEVNFKSRLIEWCQHHRLSYNFEIDNASNDDHNNIIFHSQVSIAGRVMGEGSGYTKKEAQQNAAHEAVRYIKRHKGLLEELQELQLSYTTSPTTTPPVL